MNEGQQFSLCLTDRADVDYIVKVKMIRQFGENYRF